MASSVEAMTPIQGTHNKRKITMLKQRKEIKKYIETHLPDWDGQRLHEVQIEWGCAKYGLTIHMFNQMFIGYYNAAQFCSPNTFEVIDFVKEYQELHFGDVTCDFSNSEDVANFAAQYIGEELLRDEFGNTIDEMIQDYLEEEDSEEDSEGVTA